MLDLGRSHPRLKAGFRTPPRVLSPEPMQVSSPHFHASQSFSTPSHSTPSPPRPSPQRRSQSFSNSLQIEPPKQRKPYRKRLTTDERLRIVTHALQEANFGVFEFIMALLQSKDERLTTYRISTFKSNCGRIEELLNLIWQDIKGREHVESWMGQGHALDLVCCEISKGMEASKQEFLMSSKKISVEYLQSWSVNEAGVPRAWTRVLEAATTGPQSADNTKKSPFLGSTFP